MYVCGGVCMCVVVYACVLECIYRHTWAKGNREYERKPVARKEINNVKVRARKSRSAKIGARKSRSAKIRAQKTRSAKARTQKREI
jgi:hypothetical protein